jgi:hypothetical protein
MTLYRKSIVDQLQSTSVQAFKTKRRAHGERTSAARAWRRKGRCRRQEELAQGSRSTARDGVLRHPAEAQRLEMLTCRAAKGASRPLISVVGSAGAHRWMVGFRSLSRLPVASCRCGGQRCCGRCACMRYAPGLPLPRIDRSH